MLDTSVKKEPLNGVDYNHLSIDIDSHAYDQIKLTPPTHTQSSIF